MTPGVPGPPGAAVPAVPPPQVGRSVPRRVPATCPGPLLAQAASICAFGSLRRRVRCHRLLLSWATAGAGDILVLSSPQRGPGRRSPAAHPLPGVAVPQGPCPEGTAGAGGQTPGAAWGCEWRGAAWLQGEGVGSRRRIGTGHQHGMWGTNTMHGVPTRRMGAAGTLSALVAVSAAQQAPWLTRGAH